ncbi:MAG: 2,3-bisphosphoglycerate-independent phosphoglycerate mutase [Candidatus Kerfeldbacteria bacterium CG_4_10_14_0_8_um_filter_42_10]|uniref:2,3-bisphosphoglycerate-independent phosphoglycerate mutase n=1 Tax=Candidatus Kerfeldbacteria bacterium CG_4_10_14_0_8_um_filter_42_10 TaxID=2014248 RepID=A0A2M7RHA5_9BACT|nr:MAG: 2,3-bisphosphoglycerate-independent phosphoglycerate mutase [Candidatus Kerfeldbacteria bacterium CG_4_10_14_0_8_um_filter_42_10]
MKLKNPILLVILDGWGIGKKDEYNPIFLAPTPTMDHLPQEYPHTALKAGGEGIGLEPGHQGASEIGHFIIGAGRNVLLPQHQVKQAILKGDIIKNKAYLDAIERIKKSGGALHLMGMLSNEGVHSYDITCHSLLELAAQSQLEKVYIHIFADGRDTAPKEVGVYLERLKGAIAKFKVGEIASIMGRWWAMDRDHRWERIQKAYETLTEAKAFYRYRSIEEAINQAYQRGETDEFIKPTIIEKEGNPVATIKDGDAVFNFNFRIDRAIEITQAFVEADFDAFPRTKKLNLAYVALTDYYENMSAPFAIKRMKIGNSLGEIISQAGLKQLRVTETEKWAYLTKIFNGMREEPFEGEDRILIPSDKIPTYDLKPEMKAREITETVCQKLDEEIYDVIIINFANPDILGHTANKEAILKGIVAVDQGLGQIIKKAQAKNGVTLVTADHGNAEVVHDVKLNKPHSHHTDANVPCILVSDDAAYKNLKLRPSGAIKDIAPTLLDIMNLEIPSEMTGQSLIEN